MYSSLFAVREPDDPRRGLANVWQPCLLILGVLIAPGYCCAEIPGQPATTTVPASTAVEQNLAGTKVSVFYLTNRSRSAEKSMAEAYGERRGDAQFGRCEVEFTPIPVIDQIAEKVPFYLKHETHVVSLIEQIEPAAFWRKLVSAAGSTSSGSVVLFVHGYNYGFERTCRMAAEMQRNLQGKARVLVFSWPSNGKVADYIQDQADIEWSVPLLADIIGQLEAQLGKANLQVVAHSLGTRGVVFALQQLRAECSERPIVGRLVLLAPDFDAQSFADLMPELADLIGDTTVYASSNDAPLRLSHQLTGYPRLGQGGEYLTPIEGVETIDVSSSGRYQFTGHEYFNYHPWVSADLVELLSTGAPASERAHLQPKLRNGMRYWEFSDHDQ
jgi:esterase/lipase superfamily enzyme